jgi:hypothetical protein
MTPLARNLTAALWVCWTAYCGTYESNIWPLTFGMTPAQASAALGMPLVRYAGELYVARGSIGLPGRFPADETIALQFRNGRLTGWKKNWSLDKPWIIY